MNNKINLYQQQDDLMLDSFNDIIINLTQKCRNNNLKTLLFCGSEPGVGTTTVTINLAMSLAKGNNKTLLIDSDMRKLATHKRLGEKMLLGLSDYLSETANRTDIINQTNINNLDYIACGTSTGKSAKLLNSHNLDKLISSLYENYNFILFDSPSLNAVYDAVALSVLVDGIFIITELGKTTKSNINKMIKALSGANNKILGILINKVDQPEYRMYMRNYDYFNDLKYKRKRV